MDKNGTSIQIPHSLDDLVVLRRVLTNIVREIDVLSGRRGGTEKADASQLTSTASTVSEINETLNSLDNSYLRKDGKNKATSPISYDSEMNLSGRNLIDYSTAKGLSETNNDKINSDIDVKLDGYVKKNTGSAPSLLSGDIDPSNQSSKIDEIISALILAKVLS